MKRTTFSLLTTGLVIGFAQGAAGLTIDFEDGTPGDAPVGWEFSSNSSEVQVVETVSSGSYVGGQAINTRDGGASWAGFAGNVTGTTAIQADVRWDYRGIEADDPSGTPSLYIAGWTDDGDDDTFSGNSEFSFGFAMDNDERFEILETDRQEIDNGNSSFVEGDWYRLSLTWSEADGAGDRVLTLNGYNLTTDTDLGTVAQETLTSAQFGPGPEDWSGAAIRMTRGTMDNITFVPEPTSLALLALGGLLSTRRRRG